MDDVLRSFESSMLGIWKAVLDRLPYVFVASIVFAIFLILGRIATYSIQRVGVRARLHQNLRELISRLASFALTVIGLFVAATVIFPAFRPGDLIAGLGITTVAIGFAFKGILQNFFAGILILWRRPFEVGDEICAGEFEGVVEQINSRSTRIRTYDGERAIVPNGDIYTSSILVRTAYNARRLSVDVGIGYAEPIDHVRDEILKALPRLEIVRPDPGPWVLVSSLGESSVNLRVYFWVEPRENSQIARSAVLHAVKTALDGAGIEIPFPHLVLLKEPQGAV